MTSEDIAAENSSVGDVVISVSNLGKTYRLYPSHQDRVKEALHPFRKCYHQEFSAISGVSFDIRKGESIGILGRNGAGKSTLLQILAGVLSPTSGTIKVNGKVAALLELGAGFNPDLTGRENVILFSTIQGVAENQIAERVAAIEAFADVGVFFDQPMKVYSSGMYARVAFANAIHVNPNILIIDEILGVGDARFQEKCYSKISSLRDSGVCILFVSHSTEVIQRNCESAILLEGGRLLEHGPTDATVAAYRDLLYGIKKTTDGIAEQLFDAPGSSPQNQTIMRDGELSVFMESHQNSQYQNQSYYNPYERRIGNREAEIVDFLVQADGKLQFGVLTGNETINIYIKVRFQRNVDTPHLGWALLSPEGIVIAGSNTVMQETTLASVRDGELGIYNLEIKLALCGGQYFLTLGVGDYQQQEWNYFDLRNSLIHFAVIDSGCASGFFQIPSSCKNVTNKEGEYDLLG
ncbi:MAG: ABC transporter ATP-binding protein [Methylobacter sp.]|nr:ABC transporter ATP-binding protein [Methylobacter sp.]